MIGVSASALNSFLLRNSDYKMPQLASLIKTFKISFCFEDNVNSWIYSQYVSIIVLKYQHRAISVH